MDSLTALHRELKGEWEKTPPNLRKCGNLLDELKVNDIDCCILSAAANLTLLFFTHFSSRPDCIDQSGVSANWWFGRHQKRTGYRTWRTRNRCQIQRHHQGYCCLRTVYRTAEMLLLRLQVSSCQTVRLAKHVTILLHLYFQKWNRRVTEQISIARLEFIVPAVAEPSCWIPHRIGIVATRNHPGKWIYSASIDFGTAFDGGQL